MDTVTMLLLCLWDFMVLLNFKQASKEMMMGIIGKLQSFDCNQQHTADKCQALVSYFKSINLKKNIF